MTYSIYCQLYTQPLLPLGCSAQSQTLNPKNLWHCLAQCPCLKPKPNSNNFVCMKTIRLQNISSSSSSLPHVSGGAMQHSISKHTMVSQNVSKMIWFTMANPTPSSAYSREWVF